MKKFVLVALAVLTTVISYAQTTITGKVVSGDDGSPVSYANVMVEGTKTLVFTDDDGKYEIKAPADAVLVFSQMGFTTQSIAVNGKSVINVTLQTETELLDDVMVVAYGTVKKGSYSGSASVVKEAALKDAPVVNFEQVLAGKAPGVQVGSYSGQPGAEADISIRGYGSFNAGNQPLYVIDGIAATTGDWSSGNMSTSSMNFLNPSDIESITILKDAAAASLYGSRASNGVILITTKKGKNGQMTSNFKASVGFSYFAYNNYPVASDAEQEWMHRTAWLNYGNRYPSKWQGSYSSVDAYAQAKVDQYYPARDESKYIYKDWEDVLFHVGVSQDYEYNISGGSDKARVYASVAYKDQQGVVRIDYLKRFSTTVNLDAQVNKHIKVGGNFQYSWQYQTGHQDGQSSKDNPFYQWKVILNERWPYKYRDTGELYNEPWNSSFQTRNPTVTYDAQLNDCEQNRLMLKGWVEATPIESVKIKSTVSSDWLNEVDKFCWFYGHPNFGAYGEGYASDRIRNVNKVVSSTTATFDKTFNGKHHVNVLAGWEAEREMFKYTRASQTDFSYMGAKESYLAATNKDGYSYRRNTTMLSLLGSASYDYDSRYYITGTFRRDASSRLAKDTRWGNFWSVSASWRFSNEAFLKDAEWLNDAKLRASYGTSGTLPSDHYGYMALYSFGNYGDAGSSYPSNLANTDLSWEKNKNWNVALDATIFDRYTFGIEYYEKKTTDLLLDAKIPSITGFTSTLTNIGSMRNRGLEVSVNVDILKSKDWDLSVGANLSTVKNKVLSLAEEGEYQTDGYSHIWRAGYCFYQYYTRNYLGVDPATGTAMFAKGGLYQKGTTLSRDIMDKNGKTIPAGTVLTEDMGDYTPVDNVQNASSMVIDGKTSIPKVFGGFNTDFRWKNLQFSMAWSYSFGRYIWDCAVDQMESDGYYYSHRNISTRQTNMWTPENTNTSVPIRVADIGSGYYNSTRMVKNADYVRLKNATISYNLPKNVVNKINLTNVRFYVSGSNLLTFSGLNVDPEIANHGETNFVMPPLRTYSLGLEVSF